MATPKQFLPALRGERVTILENWRHSVEASLTHLPAATFAKRGELMQTATLTLDGLIQAEKQRIEVPAEPNSEFAEKMEDCVLFWASLTLTRDETAQLINRLCEEVRSGIERRAVEGEEAVLATKLFFYELKEKLSCRQIEALEGEVNSLREEHAAAHHIANRFLASSVHELRTPLTAVIGFSELLLENTYGELTEAQIPIVGHIENSAQNLHEIINNLLDVLNYRAGKLKLKCTPIIFHQVLGQICQILMPLATRKKVIFRWELTDTGVIQADENIVRHIFYYLLSSSLRATPDGGEVSVKNKKVGERVEIIVGDTALHLPGDAIQQLREPYPLFENAQARAYEGLEVGLPLSLRYVEMHNGKVQIESRPDQGTRFIISLPVNQS